MALVIRLAVSILAGGLVAIALGYLSAVLVLLATFGTPLGADPAATGRWYYAALLVLAGLAAAAGGRLTAQLAGSDHSLATLGLALGLAALYWYGFTGTASQWPSWWAPTLAVTAGIGVWAGAAIGHHEDAGRGKIDSGGAASD